MDYQEYDMDFINEQIDNYFKTAEKKRLIRNIIFIILSVALLAIFLYLRLFNTKLQVSGTPDDGLSINVKYSTTWVLKFPAEYAFFDKGQFPVKEINHVDAPYTRAIIIDDGIEKIWPRAFSNEKSVWYLRIPSTVKWIGEYAFSGMTHLKKLDWDAAQEARIEYDAFVGIGVKNLSIPEGVISIGDYAFAQSALESVVLPDSATYFGRGVFWRCTDLKTATLPKQMETLPLEMFNTCLSLEELNQAENLSCVSLGSISNTKIKKEDLNSELYFFSPGNCYVSSKEQNGKEYWTDSNDWSNSFHYDSNNILYEYEISEPADQVCYYDMDAENRFFSEKAEIPLNVFEEPDNSDRIWIDGQYYTFPMTLGEFEKIGNWKRDPDKDQQKYWEKQESGKRVRLILDQDDPLDENTLVIGFQTSTNCPVVLPGGISNCGMQIIRAYELYPSPAGQLYQNQNTGNSAGSFMYSLPSKMNVYLETENCNITYIQVWGPQDDEE